MKHSFLVKLFCVFLILSLLSACKPAGNPESTTAAGNTVLPEATPVPQQGDGYNFNQLCAVDQFGRTFTAISGEKSDKYVGMFYWLWEGQHPADDNYNITELLESDPASLWSIKENNPISPVNQFHWWGEPLFGYYNAMDEWVIRRHIEMLTAAGVDFIAFDVSNAVTYNAVWHKVLKIIDEYIQEGWDAPRVTFFTHVHSTEVVQSLYKGLYGRNYYPDTWFCPYDNKPFIIAYDNVQDDIKLARKGGDNTYNPEPLSEEIKNFFHFQKPQWPDEPFDANAFPWVDWVYPQAKHVNVMSVSPAQHPGTPFSHSVQYEGYTTWGRGWNGQSNSKDRMRQGTNFQMQWDTVFSVDPQIAFLDGWNEWIALKWIYNGNCIVFSDAVNEEYSRDIEPMKGGYEDNFYLQTIQNVRKFKGLYDAVPNPVSATIEISGPVSQWDAVTNVYRDFGTANYKRSSKDSCGKNIYTQAAPRNNIQEIKVTHDRDYVYFYLRAENDITPYDHTNNWMNLLIGTGQPSQKGWEGYEYVLNRKPGQNTTSIDRLFEDFSAEPVGKADYTLSGNIMQIKIAKKDLGIASESFSLYFKAADAVEHPEEIMNYYTSGQSLPLGRLSYLYEYKK